MSDPVNHPSHYTQGTIEVIDAIEGMGLPHHEGNIVKYVARWRHKAGVVDLKKARWYLNRLIENAESEELDAIEALAKKPCPHHGPGEYCVTCFPDGLPTA